MSTPGGNLYFRSCKPNSEVEVGGDEEDTELPYEEGLADEFIQSDVTRHFAFETLPENVSTNEYLNRFWENIESLNRGEEFDAGDDEDAGVFNTNEEVYFHPMKNDNNEEEYGEGERGSAAEGSSGSLPLSLDEAEEELQQLESAGEFEEHSTMPHLLQNFTRLKAIDISGYGIKSVKTIGPMIPYVLKINASHNEIRTFLDIETPPVALKEADFSHNQISTVRNLSIFWALTDIDLSYNDLTTVHGFSDLEFLQTLNVSHNKIKSIKCLKCPNLLILYLNSNMLKEVSGLEECTTLKCINLNKNKISSLQGLKFMASLTDLYISDNNISNIFEFENVRPLLNLTHIRVEPGNPIQTLENWRLVLIHMLPQLLFMDGQRLDPVEIRLAENIFRPSFKKTAFMDQAGILLDKACQAANSIFEVFCRTRPFPPLLLLVGPPRSHCHTLALLLKQKFKSKVFLGGVHSTATTVEGSHPHLDIPVSFESFVQMKNSGEFLCTSHILGRVCGFSTSQIARAAEKGAVLVANVPLSIAISLREWNFKPRLVLIMSKSAPAFYENEQRIATINRNNQLENEERRRSFDNDEDGLPNLNEENEDHHLVNFSETPAFVASILKKEREPLALVDNEDWDFPKNAAKHSILKSPHFEVRPSVYFPAQITRFADAARTDSTSSSIHEKKSSTKGNARIVGNFDDKVDLENKKRQLKSLAPGMERYQNDDDVKDDDYDSTDEPVHIDTHDEPLKDELPGTSSGIELKKSTSSKGSARIIGNFDDKVDLENKKRRLKSLAPGKEKYQDGDDDDVKNSDYDSSKEAAHIDTPDEPLKEELPDTFSGIELKKSTSSKGSARIIGNFDDKVDLENKKRRLKSLAPGKEKYQNDDDDDDNGHNANDELVNIDEPLNDDLKNTFSGFELKKSTSSKGSARIIGVFRDEVDLENKKRRYKSLAPGKEKYDNLDNDDDDESGDNADAFDALNDIANENGEDESLIKEDEQLENEISDDPGKAQNANWNEDFSGEELNDGILTETLEDDDEEALQMEEGDIEENPDEINEGQMDEISGEDGQEDMNMNSSEEVGSAEDEEEEEARDTMLRFSKSGAVHRLSTSENEYHQRHIDAMMDSIIQTREEYAEFHEQNPGFFHVALEANDLCDTFEKLADFAASCLKKFQDESSNRSLVESHGGKNKMDEENFAAERLRDFKKSATLWSKGHDVLSTLDHVERKPNYYKEVQPREILLEKSSCHSNLLDPTLLRPKITLKMKRIVELHEKQLKCSSTTKD